MGGVVRPGGQHDLRVGRQLYPAGPAAPVGDRDATHLSVALGGYDDFEPGCQGLVPPDELRAVFLVRDVVAAWLGTGRLIAGRPHGAAVHITEEYESTPVVAGRVLPPAGDVEVLPTAVARAGARHHDGIAAVRQQVGVRRDGVRRVDRPRPQRDVILWLDVQSGFFGSDAGDRQGARRALL